MTEDHEEYTTTKYVVKAKFEVDGVVEKPDVVGAIFGQTEGLLGDELDLRELQKTGRIGRIIVNINTQSGKSSGVVIIPSSIDKVETAVLASSMETIDRVGPCTARFWIDRIEDVRELKRKKITKRASEILREWEEKIAPESKEITDMVMDTIKGGEIGKYGSEELPAGPAIEESDTVIVVEGRADVQNLLRYGFKNVVAVEGTRVPQSIIDLSRKKTIIAFLDGDRGGDLILKELMQVADVDYVTRAPVGKDVEELTRKEIVKALRNKVPGEQATVVADKNQHVAQDKAKEPRVTEPKVTEPKVTEPKVTEPKVTEPKVTEPKETEPKETKEKKEKSPGHSGQLKKYVESVNGTLKAMVLNDKLELVKEIPVGEITEAISSLDKIHAIVFDGVITQRLIDLASEKGAGLLIGARRGNIAKQPVNMSVKTFKDI
ncbi:MAG: DNA primase DnaG [Promethearchaeati archaeon SRVP18_Atabeyarchaeia-1]